MYRVVSHKKKSTVNLDDGSQIVILLLSLESVVKKKFFYLKKFEVVKNLSMEKKLKKKQCAKSVNSRMSFNIFLRYFLREEFFWQYHWDPQRERITLYMEELKRLLLVINGTTRCAR